MTGGIEEPQAPAAAKPLDDLGIGSGWIAEGWPTEPLRATATRDIGAALGCSLADLEALLDAGAVPAANLSVIIGGVPVPQDKYAQGGQINAAVVAQLRAGGATIGLRELTRLLPDVAQFAEALSVSLGEQVQVNGYLTPPGNQGFAHHYDTHTAVIVQLAGNKVWEFFDPIVVDPVFPYQQWTSQAGAVYKERLPQLNVWAEWTLSPGDVLWVPRGWIHNPYTPPDSAEPSLHLTLGVLESTYVGAFDRLARVAARSEAMRKAFPPATSPEARAEELRQALREWLETAELRRAFE